MPGFQNVSKPFSGEHRPGALPPSGPRVPSDPKASCGHARRNQQPQRPHLVAGSPKPRQRQNANRTQPSHKPAQQKVAPPQQDAAASSSHAEEAPSQGDVTAARDITDNKEVTRHEAVAPPLPPPKESIHKDNAPDKDDVGLGDDSSSKKDASPQPAIASPEDTGEVTIITAPNGTEETHPNDCPHLPCTRAECVMNHTDHQQVPPPCYDFHFLAEGCAYGSFCQYFHYTENQKGTIDHHHYVFSQPKRTIHVEKNGQMETKEVDNRAQELHTVLGYDPNTLFSFNICPEHFSGLRHETNRQYTSLKATGESMQHYYDHKRDQCGDEHKELWQLCPYDHSVQDMTGSLHLRQPQQAKSEVHSWANEDLKVDPILVEFCGGDPYDLIAREIDIDTAQAFLDFCASEAVKQLAYEKAAQEAARAAAEAAVEEAAREASKDPVMFFKMHNMKAMLMARIKKKQNEEAGFKVNGVDGIKRKLEDISDPEPTPISVKRRCFDVSPPTMTILAANSAAAAAAAAPPPPPPTTAPTAAKTPAASSSNKRKRLDDNDDDHQPAESGRIKKMRRDRPGFSDTQSQIENSMRRQHQRQRKAEAPAAPSSITSNKRKRVDEYQPSAPESATGSNKRKRVDEHESSVPRSTDSNKRKREDEDMPRSNESGSNKKPRLSVLSNESSASSTPSREPSPIFSKAGSPASSASSAPSPPPTASPLPPPVPIPSKAGISESASSSPPTTGPSYPPMPKCPVGVRMSMVEYRTQLRKYNELKVAGEAKADERRMLRDLLARSMQMRGLDEPNPVARARIYRSLKCGPEWDPC